MFELRYDTKYSEKTYEYYDIYKDGKPYYKYEILGGLLSFLLSFEVDRYNKTIQFTSIEDEIINEICSDRQELYLLILSLYDELDIKSYKVIGSDLLSNEFKDIIEGEC